MVSMRRKHIDGIARNMPRGRANRAFNNAPQLLWRMGLERLIDSEFMLLTTTGRKSGLPRRAVVGYHTLEEHKVIYSGRGDQSDWYRNLTQNPLVTIQSRDGVEHMRAQRITDPETLYSILRTLAVSKPRAYGLYLRFLGTDNPTVETLSTQAEHFYVIRLTPTEESTPLPLAADLKWMPSALTSLTMSAVMALLLLRRRPGTRRTQV
jgi:deazaflavin-dependent oxidoreductase (nitroreductase family)